MDFQTANDHVAVEELFASSETVAHARTTQAISGKDVGRMCHHIDVVVSVHEPKGAQAKREHSDHLTHTAGCQRLGPQTNLPNGALYATDCSHQCMHFIHPYIHSI